MKIRLHSPLNRSLFLFVALSALFSLRGLISAQPLPPPGITGVLNIIHGDSALQGDQIHYVLTTPAGDVPLSFAPEARDGIDLFRLYRKEITVELSPVRDPSGVFVATSVIPSSTREYGDPPVGVQTWVNLPCKLAGVSVEPKTPAEITSLYANSDQYADHFYRATSHNAISLSVTTRPWKSLAKSVAQYQSDFPILGDRLSAVFDDCVALHNADVTFTANMGIAIVFNDNSLFSNFAYGGSRTRMLDGVNESWRALWLPPFGYANCYDVCGGTILVVHEMGHAFGMPHSNNDDGDTDPYDNPWDLMSDMYEQGFNPGPISYLPFTSNMYHYDLVGWVDAADKFVYGSSPSLVTIDHWGLSGTPNYFMAVVPIDGNDRFYVIESHHQSAGGYQSKLPGSGVLVYEVQPNRPGSSQPAWLKRATSDAASGASAALQVGESFVNSSKGITISVVAATANGYQVMISGAPVVALTPNPGTLITEGDSFEIGVSLAEQVDKDIVLSFAVTPYTALRPADDYTVPLNTVSIPAGSTSGTLTVFTNDDAFAEDPEQFLVSVVKTKNAAVIGDSEFLVTVGDNDVPGTTEPYSLNLNSTFEGAAGRSLQQPPWKIIRPTGGDKFVCKGKGHQGSECAMQFKGGTSENSQLKGIFTFESYDVGTSDFASVRGAVKASGAVLGKIKLKAKVTFSSGATQVLKAPRPSSAGSWEVLASTPVPLIESLIEKVMLTATFTGTSGKAMLDDFALELSEGAVRGVIPQGVLRGG